ncbi:MAG: undecaprenyl-diphosphatase UppP [Acidobacteria bacterium]|nr:undecaprenyl-diphosphatase UppP [Acidobacteriota bacterium]
MTLKQAIVLGAVQGLTEFLPISSSAHLILVPWITDWPDQGLTFDVVLHAATLLAILTCFWRDLAGILGESFQPSGNRSHERPQGRHMLLFLLVGTLPAAIAGMLAEEFVATQLRTAEIIPVTLIVFALLLWLAERRATLKKGLGKISLTDSLWVGMAQAVALIPGTSRSGITITAGLFRGMTREAAARFSFLLAVPILAAASLRKLLEINQLGIPEGEAMSLAAGFLTALIVGHVTIKVFIRFLRKKTLYVFVRYRILLGIVILVILQRGGL